MDYISFMIKYISIKLLKLVFIISWNISFIITLNIIIISFIIKVIADSNKKNIMIKHYFWDIIYNY